MLHNIVTTYLKSKFYNPQIWDKISANLQSSNGDLNKIFKFQPNNQIMSVVEFTSVSTTSCK